MPVTGVWVRHVAAGVNGLAPSRGGSGGRLHRAGTSALYLADCEQTAWAEWYRWLAEWRRPPMEDLPRELYRIAVALDDVADLRSERARRSLALPRLRPSRQQWPAFQQAGERLAAEGAQAVLYASAARAGAVCLCVFAAGLRGLGVLGEPELVAEPPVPPRGLRT